MNFTKCVRESRELMLVRIRLLYLRGQREHTIDFSKQIFGTAGQSYQVREKSRK